MSMLKLCRGFSDLALPCFRVSGAWKCRMLKAQHLRGRGSLQWAIHRRPALCGAAQRLCGVKGAPRGDRPDALRGDLRPALVPAPY